MSVDVVKGAAHGPRNNLHGCQLLGNYPKCVGISSDLERENTEGNKTLKYLFVRICWASVALCCARLTTTVACSLLYNRATK